MGTSVKNWIDGVPLTDSEFPDTESGTNKIWIDGSPYVIITYSPPTGEPVLMLIPSVAVINRIPQIGRF